MAYQCEHFHRHLDGLTQNGWAPINRLKAHMHLLHCPACRQLKAQDDEIKAILAALPLVEAPSEALERLEALGEPHVHGKPALKTRWHWHLKPGWTMALGSVAAVMVIILVLQNSGNNIPGPESQQAYSQAEILKARAEARYALSLVGRKVKQAEKKSVEHIFLDKLPQTVGRSLKQSLSVIKGG